MHMREAIKSVVLLMILTTSFARAQEPVAPPMESLGAADTEATTQHHAAEAEHAKQTPVVSHDTRWAGIVVMIVLALFFCAAVVGLLVRLNAPPEELPPPSHSHDEPPGASHHHGHGGTHDPNEPVEGHGSGGAHGHH